MSVDFKPIAEALAGLSVPQNMLVQSINKLVTIATTIKNAVQPLNDTVANNIDVLTRTIASNNVRLSSARLDTIGNNRRDVKRLEGETPLERLTEVKIGDLQDDVGLANKFIDELESNLRETFDKELSSEILSSFTDLKNRIKQQLALSDSDLSGFSGFGNIISNIQSDLAREEASRVKKDTTKNNPLKFFADTRKI